MWMENVMQKVNLQAPYEDFADKIILALGTKIEIPYDIKLNFAHELFQVIYVLKKNAKSILLTKPQYFTWYAEALCKLVEAINNFERHASKIQAHGPFALHSFNMDSAFHNDTTLADLKIYLSSAYAAAKQASKVKVKPGRKSKLALNCALAAAILYKQHLRVGPKARDDQNRQPGPFDRVCDVVEQLIAIKISGHMREQVADLVGDFMGGNLAEMFR